MKKFLILVFLITVFFSCSTKVEKKHPIAGKLSNTKGGTIFLEQTIPGSSTTIDSTTISPQGEFYFDTKIKEKGFYRLRISASSYAALILDSSQYITVEGDAADLRNTYLVDGSDETLLLIDLNNTSRKNSQKLDSLQRTYEAFVNSAQMNAAKMDSVSKAVEVPYTSISNEQNGYVTGLIDKNTNRLVSLAAVQKLNVETYFDYYDKVDKALYALYPNSPDVEFFHKNVERFRKISVGNVAPDFSLNTPDEKNILLSQFKGKYVLIDFWASWCKPCRAESPAMVKLYNKFKNKVEFLGVSLDEEKAAWTEAIAKDDLSWTHVSDLQGWESPVARLYSVNSIPYTMILDTDGKIVAKGLRGAELEKKLEILMK